MIDASSWGPADWAVAVLAAASIVRLLVPFVEWAFGLLGMAMVWIFNLGKRGA